MQINPLLIADRCVLFYAGGISQGTVGSVTASMR